ncbi:hypothetical protein OG937_45925 [Streptomyces sp. NBC_00510]
MSRGCSRGRLLLVAVTVLVLVACLAAAWALPRPTAAATTGPSGQTVSVVASSATGQGPCDLIAGPARAYCGPQAGTSVAVSGGASGQGLWLVGFSTAAIAAAVALTVTAGRRRGR